MMKLLVTDLDLKGKRVLVRVDFNVPLDDQGNITDDRRIVASLPTIQHVIDQGGRAIVMSHLGRPKGTVVPSMSLAPAARRLGELLIPPREVPLAPDCVGPSVQEMVNAMDDGDIMLLENLRFHAEETDNDPTFAQELAHLGDLFVNDAFGAAHRAHASTEGITHYLERRAAGFLMQRELEFLGGALESPARPFVAILGGAKVSGKIDVIRNLFDKVDRFLIGGGMAFTFLRAKGLTVGNSLVEEDRIEMAREILGRVKTSAVHLLLPVDCVIARQKERDADSKTVPVESISEGWMGLDIGSCTSRIFADAVKGAKTIVWNGPMGVFEIDQFMGGTRSLCQAVADATVAGATSIVGGGDTAAAVAQLGMDQAISHISTGGGASLEFLEGKDLPGVVRLSDK
jgi:phosphoglycerate kinase